tara:strand:+ start:32772 stop:32963 length:192 start_codon:yes stop_codon:yes gene_type:complete
LNGRRASATSTVRQRTTIFYVSISSLSLSIEIQAIEIGFTSLRKRYYYCLKWNGQKLCINEKE